jgi:nuclear transport factor 2 (NTF2) superfamily protein
MSMTDAKPPVPPFTRETADQKVQAAEDAWNARGEVALLHDVPRTAACLARTDVELYALNRESFVAAVGGDMRSSGTAEEVMTRRLDELSELARPTRASP